MSDKIFPPEALEAFSRIYPEQPSLLPHRLIDHPLFELEALIALAQRIRPVDAEYNRGDVPVGLDPAATPQNGLSVADTIRSIEECGSWMVLKFVEQDPVYRALLHETLAELEPVVKPVTGEMLKMEGFIFISSPGSVTPFHFDPEHNILLQVRGRKTMNVFPADDETIASSLEHERFHSGGHRNLPWQEAFAAKATPFELTPGQGIYVPVKAPHWVKNGAEPSISFSITWRSAWSYHEAYARDMNRLLRRAGIEPAPPGRFPKQNLGKSLGYRMLAKAGRLIQAPHD